MKVTQAMIDTFRRARNTKPLFSQDSEAVGLQAVLDTLPEVEPFAFTGYPDNAVYLHGNCGNVIDVLPQPAHRDTWTDIEQGNCDCETPGPWFRIYVERAQ